MRICLVRCPSPFLIDDMCFPPLGLMAVGTGLKARGHDVTIYDGPIHKVPLDFDYYGVGPTTPEYASALRLRWRVPKARIVIGGPHATLNTDDCLQDGFDCVVCGDGELIAGESEIATVCFPAEKPLDEYPIIDRSLLDPYKYKYYLNGRPATTLMTSRGCPFKCAFCCKNYDTVRFRSAESVIKEIDMLWKDYGFHALVFPEDIFILDRKRTVAICQHLKKREIIWRCLVRGDLITKYGNGFVQMMAESGCVEVGIGVESGSDEILRNIKKGETVGTIKQAIRMLKGNGIRVKGFFILALPGENRDTLNDTEAFLSEMELEDVDITIYQPYDGTPIWKDKDGYDIQWSDNIAYGERFFKGRPNEYSGNVSTSALTSEEIVLARDALEREYKSGSVCNHTSS